jgi:hypothetical protein
MESDAGEKPAPIPHVTNQRPLIDPWIVHFCGAENFSITGPTNDVNFTCNSTSDTVTCFTELAVPFHIDYSITLGYLYLNL